MKCRHSMPRRLVWSLLLVFLLLPACARSPAEIRASLGDEFTMAIGQTALINGEDLQIRFIEVVADSRCPTGVT